MTSDNGYYVNFADPTHPAIRCFYSFRLRFYSHRSWRVNSVNSVVSRFLRPAPRALAVRRRLPRPRKGRGFGFVSKGFRAFRRSHRQPLTRSSSAAEFSHRGRKGVSCIYGADLNGTFGPCCRFARDLAGNARAPGWPCWRRSCLACPALCLPRAPCGCRRPGLAGASPAAPARPGASLAACGQCDQGWGWRPGHFKA
jgi:hypothetical protein